MSSLRIYLPMVGFVIVMLALFTLVGVKDHRSVQRCESMGGQTWDSGMHCVLGNPEVVSTR